MFSFPLCTEKILCSVYVLFSTVHTENSVFSLCSLFHCTHRSFCFQFLCSLFHCAHRRICVQFMFSFPPCTQNILCSVYIIFSTVHTEVSVFSLRSLFPDTHRSFSHCPSCCSEIYRGAHSYTNKTEALFWRSVLLSSPQTAKCSRTVCLTDWLTDYPGLGTGSGPHAVAVTVQWRANRRVGIGGYWIAGLPDTQLVVTSLLCHPTLQ